MTRNTERDTTMNEQSNTLTTERKIAQAEHAAGLVGAALAQIAEDHDLDAECLLCGAQAEITRLIASELDADDAIACHLRAAQWLIMVNPTCRHALASLPQAGRC